MYKKVVAATAAIAIAFGAVGLPAVESGFSALNIDTSITASAGGNAGILLTLSGDYSYSIRDDGTAELGYYNGSDSKVTIPKEIDGRKVTAIGAYAFGYGLSDGDKITEIVIPDGVTAIGDGAFCGCENLKTITIPKTVVSIGNMAFENTKWLKNKKAENPLVAVNGILIDGKSCTGEVTIPNTVTEIAESAFACSDITSVKIPTSVKTIGRYAFADTELKTADISSSVTSIGADAFSNTDWLANKQAENPLVVVNGIVIDGEKCTGDVTIPNTVKSIADWAFMGNGEITSLTVSDSVTEIGVCAFSECSNLASVTLSENLTEIGEYVFAFCNKLTSITIPDKVTSIGSMAFESCKNLADITIPESVTDIGKFAFYDTKWLSEKTENNSYVVVNGILVECTIKAGKMNIPSDVSKIGERLSWQTEISELNVPGSVTTIGELAFNGCTTLTSVTLQEGVKCIESGAFYACYTNGNGLTSITVPKSVTEIGNQALGYTWDLSTGYTGKVDGFKIYCYSGTAGETYAKENGFDYELLDHTKHTYDSGKITKAATCTSTGVKTYTCTVCKKTKTETIAKTAHKYTVTKTVKPTTSAQGYTLKTCSVCKSTAKTNYTAKLIAMSKVKATIAKSTYAYTSKAITPTATVKYGSTTLKKGTDYTVSYKNNTKTGKATITIKGKGKYSGTLTKTFNISPKKQTVSSVKSAKTKTVTVKWKKDTQATGYQIAYSTNSKFTSSKTVTVAKNATVSKTLTKLSKGKKYYVKVRSYKTIGKTKVYGAWSAVKSCVTK